MAKKGKRGRYPKLDLNLRCGLCGQDYPADTAEVLAANLHYSPCCLHLSPVTEVIFFNFNFKGQPIRFRDEYETGRILWDWNRVRLEGYWYPANPKPPLIRQADSTAGKMCSRASRPSP